MKEKGHLVAEIKRRRLPQTAALYVAVAWGGTEILVFLIEGLFGELLAKEARRYLAILLIAGFPAAMYLAWVRDLGLQARRVLGAGALAAALVGFLLWYVKPPPPTLGPESIAVLPFDVCEERQSDETFALGLTAAVHTKLAQRRGLSIIGRRSIEAVLETSPTLSTVGEILGVKYILSGIVCREGRDPTIQAELTDNRGKIIWRQEFRETVNDYNQVEQQLAELVDNQVAAQFGDRTAGARGDVVDQEALRQLQIGKGYLEQNESEKAEDAFRKALEIEPEFPEAYNFLQIAVTHKKEQGTRGEHLRETRDILEQALDSARAQARRDPGDFDANRIAGFIIHNFSEDENEIAYMVYRELGPDGVRARKEKARAGFEEAQLYLDRALALRPRDGEMRWWVAHNLAFLGVEKRKESIEVLEEGLRLDPFNADIAWNLSTRRAEFGDVRGAMDLLDSFDALPQGKDAGLLHWQLELLNNLGRPDEQFAYEVEAFKGGPENGEKLFWALLHLPRTNANIAQLGLRDQAAVLHDVLSALPGRDRAGYLWRLFQEDFYLQALGREEEVARRNLEEVAGLSNEEILDEWMVPAAGFAWAFWQVGELERAVGLFEALAFYPHQERWSERAMDLRMALADLYHELGREDDMLAVLEEVVEYLEKEVEVGVRHPQVLAQLARAYRLRGEQDAFLKTMDLAVDYGFAFAGICCRDYLTDEQQRAFARYFSDELDALEGNPDYEIIKTRMRAIVDARRANIRALLAANDMEELLAASVVPNLLKWEEEKASGN
jgi:TolB-like protein